MSANGISHLSSKAARQVAKLDLAQTKRGNVSQIGYRINNVYDLELLPLPYGYTDDQTVNPLQYGRPWLPYATGAYRTTYTGDFNGDANWFATATAAGTQTATNFQIVTEPTNTSEQFICYLRPDYTGTWTFSMNSDDKALLWIGTTAQSGYTSGNALISTNNNTATGTISLLAGHFYALRLQYSNAGGPGSLGLSYSHTGQSATTDYTNKLYFNNTTHGF